MKLLLDQNLSADAAMILRSGGLDAVHAVTVTSIRVRTLPLAG
jgi:predicted nuclease of predicted toxin-antitoxin system